jgi:hypothetical protein
MRGKTITIILVLAAVTLIYTNPALPSLRTAVIGDGGDNYQFLGFQYLAHRLVSEGHFGLGQTTYWRYPVGVDLQSAADSMLFVAIGLVFYQFTPDPVLVYNFSILSLVFLNLVFSYAAFRTWFSRSLALIGALIYGLSFYSLSKVGGHVNLISTAGFALFFAAVYRISRDDGRARDFAMMAGSVAYLALSSLQYPLLLAGALPFLILLCWVMDRSSLVQLFQVLWRKRMLFVASAGLAILAVFPFEGRKIMEFLRSETVLPADQFIAVPPINLIVPNRYVPTIAAFIHNDSRMWIEYSIFLGFVEIVMLEISIIQIRSNPKAPLLLAAMALLFVLTLGWWPYAYLFRIMPYRGIIEPGRFYVLLYLAITLLILFQLQEVRSRLVVFLVASLIAIERLPLHFYLSPTHREEDLVAAVRARPSHAVLDLPAYTSWWNGQRYDLYSVYYDRPIVEGYFHWSGDRPSSRMLTDRLNEFRCYLEPEHVVPYDAALAKQKHDEILAALVKYDIRVVVVHRDLFGSSSQCGAVPQFVDTLLQEEERWEVLLDTPKKRVLWLRP